MDLLITIILLLLSLLISNIISHYIPSIPTALTQIAFGMLLAFVFEDISFEIDTEWFLLLFVAPLLYNDGRYFPREELWKMRAPIFGNAIVLVILTAIGGGYFINWMIPAVPLAAAFALAAILSPTDPVAVNGIAKRIHIPAGVLHLVRGESLINDASGLVAFNYAVAAVVTGYFSLSEASLDFVYKFILGALLGAVLALLITWARFILRKQGINDVTFHTLLHIITPFIIFIVTEDLLHASGVIAVVVGGIVHSLVRERREFASAEEQVLTENIWSLILFILNGVVFLLLGLNIPSSMRDTVSDPSIGNWLVIGYVLAIGVIILGIRFVWSYVFAHFEYRYLPGGAKPNLKNALFVSLTGVRGAVTMAGILSIPYFLDSGESFPARSLLLFLAAGVILFTLIAATVFLPMLSKGEEAENTEGDRDLAPFKQRLLYKAVDEIRQQMKDENKTAAYELIGEYRRRIHDLGKQQNGKMKALDVEMDVRTEIRIKAVKAERRYIQGLMDENKIDDNLFHTFEQSLEYREEALAGSLQSGTLYLVGKMFRRWRKLRKFSSKEKELVIAKIGKGKDVQIQAMKAAIEFLENYASEVEELRGQIQAVILDYKMIIERLSTSAVKYDEKQEEQKEELRIKVLDVERSEIQSMYESGEINREEVKELRRFINYVESAALYEHTE